MNAFVRLFFLSVLVTVPALAAQDFCTISFGTLTDGGDPTPLVVDTYRRLIEEVGAGLRPETLAKMAKAENPFAVPEQAGTDLFALQRNFDRLKAMVGEKGWDRPEVREGLRQFLKVRAAGTAEQTEKLDTAIRGPATQLIPFARGNETSITADGRYFISPNTSWGTKPRQTFTLNLYDSVTKQTTEIDGGKGFLYGPKFFPKGDAVLFFREKGVVRVVPFANGKLDLARAQDIGRPNANLGVTPNVHFLDNGKFFAADDITTLSLFDPKAGTRTKVNVNAFAPKDHRVDNWGPYDGKRIWLSVMGHHDGDLQYHVVTVTKDGTVLKSGPPELHPAPHWSVGTTVFPHRLAWADEGRTIFLAPAGEYGKILAWPHDRPREIVIHTEGSEPGKTMVKDIVTHPSGKEVAVLFSHQLTERAWVEVFDAKDFHRKHHIDLPRTTFQLQFTRQGKTLVGTTSKDQLAIVEYPEK